MPTNTEDLTLIEGYMKFQSYKKSQRKKISKPSSKKETLETKTKFSDDYLDSGCRLMSELGF